jgi:triphosphoribosyl-dephospho-CoA synthase CitG
MLKQAALITQSIYRALCIEVETTPKPGLVDLLSNGAHQDLSPALFKTSAKVLKPTFQTIVETAMSWNGNLESLFPLVRNIGVVGEKEMFSATNGINTHKGALFSLGILAAVTGYALKHNLSVESNQLCLLASDMTKHTLTEDFSRMKGRPLITHGEILYANLGHKGIRGEVMEGFSTLRTHIIPILPRTGTPLTEAQRIHILLVIMSVLEDTNILSRGGEKALLYIQSCAKNMLSLESTLSKTEFTNQLIQLDNELIRMNLSSGGAADLLAATLYLYEITNLSLHASLS